MDQKQLNRLNRILGDNPNCGYAPDIYNLGGGERQPRYKWVWAPDLKYPAQCGCKQTQRYKSDILCLPDFGISEPVYHEVPQLDEPLWALAKWEPPTGRELWAAKYGTELRYPERGMYIITDVVLSPGVEPNEAATRIAIMAITEQSLRNLNDFMNIAQERTDKAATRHKAEWDAMIDDAILPIVPGMRGGSRSQPLKIAKEFE
jgi:hypothetical protein